MRANAEIQVRPYLARLPMQCEAVKWGDPVPGRKKVQHWIIKGRIGGEESDLSGLGEPLEVKLANWGREPEDIARFTRKYGLLSGGADAKGEFKFIGVKWHWKQDRLRGLWEGARRSPASMVEATREILGFEGADSPPASSLEDMVSPNVSVDFAYKRARLVITFAPRDTWTYIVLNLLARNPEYLGKCKNETCTAPYFIAKRKDQEFCSSDCAKSATNRRWWRKKGKQWRARRRRKTRR